MRVGAEFESAYILLIERNLNTNNEMKKGKTPALRQMKSMPLILTLFFKHTQIYPRSSHDWMLYSVS